MPQVSFLVGLVEEIEGPGSFSGTKSCTRAIYSPEKDSYGHELRLRELGPMKVPCLNKDSLTRASLPGSQSSGDRDA